MRVDQQVVLLTRAILHMVPQQCLRLETELFERRDRALLVDRHLRDHLLDPAVQRLREDRFRQRPPQPLAPHLAADQHTQLAHVLRPWRVAEVQAALAEDPAVALRDDRHDLIGFDVVHPRRYHPGVGDVRPEEQQVVVGERLRERQELRDISPAQPPELDRAAVFEFRLPWKGKRSVRVHTDRTESHSLIFGHSRKIALGPATRLTCPPFSKTSSLSSLPTTDVTSFVASQGAMWSCWAS